MTHEPMHLLKRTISPYTSWDRLLGVFSTIAAAEEARTTYVNRVLRVGPDPWAEQAYRTVSEDDVCIVSDVPVHEVSPDAGQVVIVNSYAEGFGQVLRTFEAIVGNEARARQMAEEIEERDQEEVGWVDLHIVQVGRLHLDLGDDEPAELP